MPLPSWIWRVLKVRSLPCPHSIPQCWFCRSQTGSNNWGWNTIILTSREPQSCLWSRVEHRCLNTSAQPPTLSTLVLTGERHPLCAAPAEGWKPFSLWKAPGNILSCLRVGDSSCTLPRSTPKCLDSPGTLPAAPLAPALLTARRPDPLGEQEVLMCFLWETDPAQTQRHAC